MSQISKYPISEVVYERILDIFFKALIDIQTKGEARQFLGDFLTPTERIMLAKRLAIAFLLEKEYDYEIIRKTLRVSTPTIAAVNRIRKYGGRGFQRIIRKLLVEEKIKDFIFSVGKSVSGTLGRGGKGGGVWRYLHQELKSKTERKPF